MSKADTEHTPLFPGKLLRLFFVWPFKLLWKIVTATCTAIGILLSLLLGSALMFAGYILVTTFIGAIIGLPMMVIGAFLILRALY